jgi:hypothetical protein
MRLSTTYYSNKVIEKLDEQIIEFYKKTDFRLVKAVFNGWKRILMFERPLPWPTITDPP